ncbi:hypothetical protein BTA30_05540, partial [Bacillus swezeyi]
REHRRAGLTTNARICRHAEARKFPFLAFCRSKNLQIYPPDIKNTHLIIGYDMIFHTKTAIPICRLKVGLFVEMEQG